MLDARDGVLGRADVAGDSLAHVVSFGGKSARALAPDGIARLEFKVGAEARLYSFQVNRN